MAGCGELESLALLNWHFSSPVASPFPISCLVVAIRYAIVFFGRPGVVIEAIRSPLGRSMRTGINIFICVAHHLPPPLLAISLDVQPGLVGILFLRRNAGSRP